MQKEFNVVSFDDLRAAGYRQFRPNGIVAYSGIYMKVHSPNGPNIKAVWYDQTPKTWEEFANVFVFECDFIASDGKFFKASISDDYPLSEIEAFFEDIFKKLGCIPEGYDE
jgi:hypothetical protein